MKDHLPNREEPGDSKNGGCGLSRNLREMERGKALIEPE